MTGVESGRDMGAQLTRYRWHQCGHLVKTRKMSRETSRLGEPAETLEKAACAPKELAVPGGCWVIDSLVWEPGEELGENLA